MVRVAKVYYMIHYGEEEAKLFAIHMILDSAKALFDRLTTDRAMNAHITLSACNTSEHGIVIGRKLLFSFHRETGLTIDHAAVKVDDVLDEVRLQLPDDDADSLAKSTFLNIDNLHAV